jgi:small subunit ribosomal protein S10
MLKEKIRISLKAFNTKTLDESCQLIFETLKNIDTQVEIKGPIFLPTKKRIYCVLRSPHVNNDSREQFEIRRYKRILDIYSDSTKNLEAFLKLNFPAGTFITMKCNEA